jgi:hypothetical protein
VSAAPDDSGVVAGDQSPRLRAAGFGITTSHDELDRHPANPRPPIRDARASPLFTPLKWTSLTHSCVYTALLVCAFAAGKPEPATTVLGYTHGVLWIAMSLTCIACTRLRIVPLRLAVAVAVLGGIGPFFGSYEFIREQGRRRATDAICDEAGDEVG